MWPHGGHGDCASARAGYGVRQWARPAGTRVGGRFTALQRQRCCRFEAFSPLLWCHGRCSERPTEARKPKTQVQHKMRSPTHWGGRSMPGDHAPTQGGAMGAVLGVLLRNYGFTDLPPSLPLPRSDPVTRISESSYRRLHRGGQMHPGDHAPPQGGHRAPLWAFCYEITDLRIYPPPSPSHAPTRSRVSPNQVTAGLTLSLRSDQIRRPHSVSEGKNRTCPGPHIPSN